jgi:hypothetical protein
VLASFAPIFTVGIGICEDVHDIMYQDFTRLPGTSTSTRVMRAIVCRFAGKSICVVKYVKI